MNEDGEVTFQQVGNEGTNIMWNKFVNWIRPVAWRDLDCEEINFATYCTAGISALLFGVGFIFVCVFLGWFAWIGLGIYAIGLHTIGVRFTDRDPIQFWYIPMWIPSLLIVSVCSWLIHGLIVPDRGRVWVANRFRNPDCAIRWWLPQNWANYEADDKHVGLGISTGLLVLIAMISFAAYPLTERALPGIQWYDVVMVGAPIVYLVLLHIVGPMFLRGDPIQHIGLILWIPILIPVLLVKYATPSVKRLMRARSQWVMRRATNAPAAKLITDRSPPRCPE